MSTTGFSSVETEYKTFAQREAEYATTRSSIYMYSRSKKTFPIIFFYSNRMVERLNGNVKTAFARFVMVWSVLALNKPFVCSIVVFWQERLTHRSVTEILVRRKFWS